MTDYKGKTIYMGIDVHKNTYSVSLVHDNEVIKRDQLKAIPSILLDYCKKFKGAEIKSVYEAGFCGFHLHRFLESHGIKNIVVNPASVEVNASAVKTDKRDSLKLAVQLSAGRLKSIHIPEVLREDRRHLTRLREQIVKQKQRLSSQIKSHLHLEGIILPYSDVRVSASYIRTIRNITRGKYWSYKLNVLCAMWFYFDHYFKEVNIDIEESLRDERWLEDIYSSVPGIGRTSARKLINELGDMSQFSNEQKLASHAGLTPREHSSGGKVRKGHITKQGSPVIRRLLIEAAWVAIRSDHELEEKFNRISNRGRSKKKAIVAIARMLLCRIRTCIKQNKLYKMPVKEKTDADIKNKD